MNRTATRELADALQHEHAELGQQLGALRREIAGAINWEAFEPLLVHVRETVTRHIAFEEKEGYFTEVRRRKPTCEAEVQRLEQEHRKLEADLVRARQLVAQQNAEELKSLMCDWLALFADHETRENRLTQEAFNTDFGSGD